MTRQGRKGHWEQVYSTRGETGVSWYQSEPALSLDLIRSVAPAAHGRIIDVGGGASVLVDRLLDLGFETVAVLDISRTALETARARLGRRSGAVRWIEADVTEVRDIGTFDIWHDRAVFHFLTEAADRARYAELARRTVLPGGHLIIATFADDGPRRCSDLDVCRYNPGSLASEFGNGFSLVGSAGETHTTPWGSQQAFTYGVFRRQ
ncbi:class I SAM-dependent methyltransferase [Tautonia plasticadhaerens]|uniref:Ubiquinone biosynthesis O-methyltransferase n=1 Tax=Tautonia plasticadhaerens TaxID=2527974 RepID=A0A518H417_9BACT|nr:class I SAM-dependent methyltransferase [Tautonia plasticadhaerens]QDV35572.1 Ubiquinone biosynthesis O-methyltransferase [Tautonia plasticadhaerens]